MKLAIKLIVLSLICAIPAGLLGYDLLTDNLGANPVETLEHTTGDWTIYFLLLTLSMTPLQQMLAPKWPIPFHLIRRTLGLSAFVYALLHLAIYFVFDMSADLNEALTDIAERPFILIGMLALILLIPLAITSTQGWQRRLKRNWQTLHKLVYPITFLGILHYALLVKADLFMPLLYMTLFGILMLMRQFKLPRLR